MRARPVGGGGPAEAATSATRSTPGGGAPPRAARSPGRRRRCARAGSSGRRRGRGRGRRGTSGPARTRRPTARRCASGPAADGFDRWVKVTTRPARLAASSGANAGSVARSRGCTADAASGSTAIPAARSFCSAVRAAPASAGESHSRAASATAVASSGARSMSGELVVAAGDPVAVDGLGHRGPPGLQRHPELAQLGLVPLEHPEERLVGRDVRVARHRGPDALGAEELARREQAEHEVDQAFGARGRAGRHLRGAYGPSPRCSNAGAPASRIRSSPSCAAPARSAPGRRRRGRPRSGSSRGWCARSRW